jgi:DDE superfamily endonuclease
MSLHGAVVLTPDEVLKRGLKLVGFTDTQIGRVKEKKNQSRFRTHYGAHPLVYAVLLTRLQETTDENARLEFDTTSRKGRLLVDQTLKYLFMAIHFLSCYPTEEQAEAIFTVCDKTYRYWVWHIVEKIALLKDEVICWPESWNNADNEEDPISQTIFTITVDGTHCRIQEPTHEDFSENTRYFSHKFKSAAYDYEIAISIFDERVVWAAGPYPAGTNDITIFRHKLKDKILESQAHSGVQHHAIGDKGYRGEREIVSVPSSHDKPEVRTFKARALARHETFNARLKNFDCLEERFRHTGHPRRKEVSGAEVKHQWCFNAILVICQLQIENGFPLFSV